jgi:hypothetical protein
MPRALALDVQNVFAWRYFTFSASEVKADYRREISLGSQ